MKILAPLVLSVLLLSGCEGCKSSLEADLYRQACHALRTDASVPPRAVPLEMSQAIVSVGKNAGSVELPYEYVSATGEKKKGSLTVWFKRPARDWVIDRTNPTPVYNP